MANSYIEVSTTGSFYVLPASFNYLDINDIHALGKENNGTYTVLTISNRIASSRIIILSGTPSQPYVRFYRTTSSAALVDFVDGARLTEADLDKAYRQGLYAAQEVLENASTGVTGYNITNIASSQLQLPLTNFSSTGIDDNADATAITITSAEKIGIGHANPAATVDIRKSGLASLGIGSTDASGAIISLDGDSNGDFSGSDYSYIQHVNDGRLDIVQDSPSGTNEMRFYTNGTPRMKIDTAGNVLVAKSSSGQVLTQGVELSNAGGVFSTTANATNSSYFVNKDTSGTRFLIRFYAGSSHVGSITSDGSSTTYATSSDYRLKENITTSWDATTRLKQLKPCRFNFISDETNTLVDGFLAHEVQSVVPEAISGEKDAVDADGNPDYQGIDQSKLVPLLVKTIQELEARVTALEA